LYYTTLRALGVFFIRLSIHQNASAHHTCQHQGVFVIVIITLPNGPLYDK